MLSKVLNWYTSRQALPFWFVLIADALIVYVAGFVAYALNHSPSAATANLIPLMLALAAYLICFLVGFRLFHTYAGIIRKTTVADMGRVWMALLTGVILVMGLRAVAHSDDWLLAMKIRDLLLQAMIASIGMCGLRGVGKVIYDLYLRHSSRGGAYGYADSDLLSMEMSDLLQREPIATNFSGIRRVLHGKRVMVTGAAGSIGSELSMLLAQCEPEELVLLDQAESPLHSVRIEMARLFPAVKCSTIVMNICHSHRMERIFSEYRPEYVFHAAAYKHVPMMEDNPVESVLNNVDGTRKLADLSKRYGVDKFVMISTDKAVNPTNVMGCSKRICEMYCQSLAHDPSCHTQFITTRFGNVLGSNGSVIPTFRDQIRRGGPVLVTHPKVIRYFMLISEACALVLEAATMGNGGEVFAFDMGQPVRIVDLARRMITLSGRMDVKIAYTGLRPGEKLYEEVLASNETTLPTSHPKIRIARTAPCDHEFTRRSIERLIDMARTYDPRETVAMMKRIVPEYKSSPNSPYALLDPASAPRIIKPKENIITALRAQVATL